MKDYLFSYIKKRQYTLLFWDIVVMSLAVFLSYAIRVYLNQKNPTLYMVLSRLSQVKPLADHRYCIPSVYTLFAGPVQFKPYRESDSLIGYGGFERVAGRLDYQRCFLFPAQVRFWTSGAPDSSCRAFGLDGFVEAAVFKDHIAKQRSQAIGSSRRWTDYIFFH